MHIRFSLSTRMLLVSILVSMLGIADRAEAYSCGASTTTA
jgi:hypothetical protein